MKNIIAIYNKKRSLFADKLTFTRNNRDFSPSELCTSIAIIIPASNEYPGIFNTLDSLAQSIKKNSKQFTVVIVINNSKDASKSIQQNNKILYQVNDSKKANETFFYSSIYPFKIKVFYLSDSIKKKGVGYARRYGMDWAIASGAKILACMDADTLVSKNYATELIQFKKNSEDKSVFALTQFEHQKVDSDLNTVKLQQSIDAYQSYIKQHSLFLRQTGTPYWPYALGPTIVCTAKAYAEVGGMPMRSAGEDFYFVQSLVKLSIQQTSSVSAMHASFNQPTILQCTVYPASRLSERVPFGTGPVLLSVLSGKSIPKVYTSRVYNSIKLLITQIHENISYIKNGDLNKVLSILPTEVARFLEKENFLEVWKKIAKENEKCPQRLETAFHIWFDGLKIIRLIHYLEDMY